MLGNIFPPFTTMQEMNLDWILTKVKNILRFVPDDGAVGQILRRTRSGAEWSDEQGGSGAVNSVNGQTGDVVLTASDVGALPDTTVIPDSTSDLVNDAGFVDAAGAAAAAPVQSVNGQTGTVSLDADDVGALPDTYVAPVTSVNGQTGAVSLTIPDSTSDLVNDAGFVDAAGAAAAAPVQSVNGQTGAVIIATGGFELLWENPDTTSNFSGQIIPLPTNTCTAFMIIYNYASNRDPIIGNVVFKVGEKSLMQVAITTNMAVGNFYGLMCRATSASTQTSITFDDAHLVPVSGQNSTNNLYLTPVRIYGIHT